MNRRQTFGIEWSVENLIHRVYSEKLTALCVLWKTYCTVNCGKLTALCVLWKTYCIVCTVENLLHCVFCGKLTASYVLWKTYCTVCSVENLLHRTIRRQTFDIVCIVENLLWSYDLSTNIWHCVYCEKHFALCVSPTNIWHFVNCEKLTSLCVLWKTCDFVVCEFSTSSLCGLDRKSVV